MLRAFYGAIGWEENDGSDDTYASFTMGGLRLALYPLDRLGNEAAPGDEVVASDAWNGVTLGVNVATREELQDAYAGRAGGRGRRYRVPRRAFVGWRLRLLRRPGGPSLGARVGSLVHHLRVAPPDRRMVRATVDS